MVEWCQSIILGAEGLTKNGLKTVFTIRQPPPFIISRKYHPVCVSL